MSDLPTSSRQLLSCVTSGGKLQLTIGETPVVAPGDAEVVVRIEASPINPSDLGLLLGMADITQAQTVGENHVEADVPANVLPMLKARFDEAMPVGNEGSGIVVAAGSSAEAQALLGKKLLVFWAGQCIPSTEPCTPASVWSCMMALVPERVLPASLIR